MATYTQTDLDNISAAIASGVLSATIAGETVVYRSQADLLKAQRLIRADLAPSNAPQKFPLRYPTTGRGL